MSARQRENIMSLLKSRSMPFVQPDIMEMLVDFVHSGTVGPEVSAPAASAIIDTLAVMIAGGNEPGPRRLASTLEPADGGPGVPSLWTGKSYRPDDAALLLGMAGHVLDYDDVSMITICHPSAPVLSAALCARPWRDVSGKELIEAFAIGAEVMIRIGEAMGFRHYALGFHATGTLGVFGAAAACARLMRLDRTGVANALAIAASLSCGLRRNFGSMVKSLHVGVAASNGLKAARLAAAGIEGSHDILEADGYLHAYTGGTVSDWNGAVALGAPYAIADPGFEQKRYPCCYMLHKTIEATLSMAREANISLSDVATARVEYPVGGAKPLIHPFPKSGLNALFSAPYAVIAGLADRSIDFRSFTNEAVMREDIQRRLRDVEVVETGEAFGSGADVGKAPVTVTLRMKNGDTLVRTVTASPGSKEDPLTDEQLGQKWNDCVRRAAPDVHDGELVRLYEQGRHIHDAKSVEEWLTGIAAVVRGNSDARA